MNFRILETDHWKGITSTLSEKIKSSIVQRSIMIFKEKWSSPLGFTEIPII